MKIKTERNLIWMLAAIQLTNIIDFMIMMPLGPQLMEIFSIDALQFGGLVSVYTATSAVASLISAFFLDRFDRRPVLILCYGLFAVATLACGLAETYWQLMAARFAAGFFGGVVGVLIPTMVADVVPFERRGAAMGKVMAAFSVATVAGVPLGLLAANALGWHSPFLLLALVSGFIAVAAYRFTPSLSAHIDGDKAPVVRTLWKVLATSRYWLAYGFSMLMIFTGFSVIPFITLQIQGNLGISPERIPFIYLVGGIATLLTAPLIGKFSDRYGKHKIFTGLAILAIIPVFMITHLESDNFNLILVTTTLFFVFVSGRMIPAMAMVSEVPDPKERGAFMSLNNTVQSASIALASFLGGWLAGGDGGQLENYALNGYAGIVASLASIGMMSLMLKSMRKTNAQ